MGNLSVVLMLEAAIQKHLFWYPQFFFFPFLSHLGKMKAAKLFISPKLAV